MIRIIQILFILVLIICFYLYYSYGLNISLSEVYDYT